VSHKSTKYFILLLKRKPTFLTKILINDDMITEHYDYFAYESKTLYLFESEGEQGAIVKIVIFTHYEGVFWNLAFGDVSGNSIDDSVVSNNHDIVKVMSTIGKIVYDFSAQYPTRGIYIRPVDEKRKKLYNHVFRRNYDVINRIFDVVGIFDAIEEDYSPKKSYDVFKLKRKFVK
jgi:hypothetical protein